MDCLPEREKVILALRYGLENEEPKSLEQTGETVSLSRESVRKLEIKALEKLKGGSRLRSWFYAVMHPADRLLYSGPAERQRA